MRNQLELCRGIKIGALALGEEHKLRLFKNRALRKIFGLKREEGKWA